MSDTDPQTRFRATLKGELTEEQRQGLLAYLTREALDQVLEVKMVEIKPPKVHEPLIHTPEHLAGRLGGVTLPEYQEKLEALGKGKDFINRTWNDLLRKGIVRVNIESSDGSEAESQVPMISYESTFYDGSLLNVVYLTDIKKNRKPWYITSQQVADAGHFIDLDLLAPYIESDAWRTEPIGIGTTTAGVWAEIITDRIAFLSQTEHELSETASE